MNVIGKININQKQKLNLTPFLKQSIDILKFSDQELESFINEELLRNPILIRKKPITGNPSTKSSENYFYENISSSSNSLTDYLQEQINLLILSKQQKNVMEFIIGNINKNGYLDITREEIQKEYSVSLKETNKLIDLLKTLDPPGIGAWDLKDCLLIQLRRKNLQDTLAYQIIENALEDLAKKKYNQISRKFAVSLDEIEKAKKIILSLNPNPASQFIEINKTEYIVPDLLVKKVNEEYTVSLNSNLSGSSLKINSYYLNIDKTNCTEEELNYINEKIQSATNILNNIEKRNQTILSITSLIIKNQKVYFDSDDKSQLKALTRKTIARQLNIHESTVSRAVSGKFLKYKQSIISLKYFFQTGLKITENKSISINQIKFKIKEIIDSENKKNPFSDKIITDKINKNGIPISRRCVTKYRISMNIPSSSNRKFF